LQGHVEHLETELAQRMAEYQGVIGRLQSDLAQRTAKYEAVVEQLGQQLSDRRTELVEVRSRATRVMGELQSREHQLAQIRTLVDRIDGSTSWRLTGPLRFLFDALKRRSVQPAGRLGMGGTSGRPVISDKLKLDAAGEDRPPTGGMQEPAAEVSAADSTEPETELQILERSGLFDEKFYRESNPDVAVGEVSPLEHYFHFGAFEGRPPNPLFDSAYCLITNPDVAKAGVNPALHYLMHGAREGRDPSADFDTSFYLEANPEVAASGTNPLVHYSRCGANQGRSPLPSDRSALPT
jgi:hypothetical protein